MESIGSIENTPIPMESPELYSCHRPKEAYCSRYKHTTEVYSQDFKYKPRKETSAQRIVYVLSLNPRFEISYVKNKRTTLCIALS